MNLPSYDVTTLPFTVKTGVLINNSGLVVGGILNPNGSISLGDWSDGVLTNLGAPSGLPSNFNVVQPIGMNNAGAIVGAVRTPIGGVPSLAFLYSSGIFTVLPPVNSADSGNLATAINSGGKIVGYDLTAANGTQPWLWSNGAYSSVPVSGISATALGINSSGTILGNRVTNCCSGQSGYLSENGTTQYLTGALNALNNAGEATGVSHSVGLPQNAIIFRDGITTSILSVPSSGFGINSAGDVVGFYQPNGFNGPRVFLWEPHLGALDLTPAEYLFAVALAINSSGDIVGYGETTAGAYQDFLLTPDPHGTLTATELLTSPPPSGVPEPDTWFLFGLGLAATIVMRRSKRPCLVAASRPK
jgi:hypothetical protein